MTGRHLSGSEAWLHGDSKAATRAWGGVYGNYGAALMCAASTGHTEVVKLLPEDESCTKDTSGMPAIMYATVNNHVEIAELLLKRGASARQI